MTLHHSSPFSYHRNFISKGLHLEVGRSARCDTTVTHRAAFGQSLRGICKQKKLPSWRGRRKEEEETTVYIMCICMYVYIYIYVYYIYTVPYQTKPYHASMTNFGRSWLRKGPNLPRAPGSEPASFWSLWPRRLKEDASTTVLICSVTPEVWRAKQCRRSVDQYRSVWYVVSQHQNSW